MLLNDHVLFCCCCCCFVLFRAQVFVESNQYLSPFITIAVFAFQCMQQRHEEINEKETKNDNKNKSVYVQNENIIFDWQNKYAECVLKSFLFYIKILFLSVIFFSFFSFLCCFDSSSCLYVIFVFAENKIDGGVGNVFVCNYFHYTLVITSRWITSFGSSFCMQHFLCFLLLFLMLFHKPKSLNSTVTQWILYILSVNSDSRLFCFQLVHCLLCFFFRNFVRSTIHKCSIYKNRPVFILVFFVHVFSSVFSKMLLVNLTAPSTTTSTMMIKKTKGDFSRIKQETIETKQNLSKEKYSVYSSFFSWLLLPFLSVSVPLLFQKMKQNLLGANKKTTQYFPTTKT